MSQEKPDTFGRRGVPADETRRASRSEPAAYVPPEVYPSATTFPYVDIVDPTHVETAVVDDEMDMMRYIGANWPKYRDLWHEMKGSPDLKRNFSFAAFFLTTTWMLYRKLYAYAFLSLAAVSVIMVVAPKIAPIFNIYLCFTMGFYGKSLVIRQATKTIDAIKTMDLSKDEAALRIEKSGGVNLFAALIMLGVFIFAGFISGFAGVAAKRLPADMPSAGVERKI